MLAIHDDTNVGSLFINNNSDEPKEVSITTEFGYPDSDSLGNLEMNYDDTKAEEQYGLDEDIRIFPRSFVIKPNQQQTVRLQVRPSQDRSNGVYWTRISVTSNAVTPEVDEKETEGITTQINYQFEQNIAAFYHKGKTTTGVEVRDIEVEQNDDILTIIAQLSRTGNSPFLGSIHAELYDQSGQKVGEAETTTTVYFDESRQLDLNAEDLPQGTYLLEVSLETKRRDISPQNLVQAPQITETISVEL
ncbi:hypothetical protein [Fodinibius salsisoli]|uniref:Uncharacterized protein n=1 Tax=Fodinibius salsisoli TaxID=2820877 RepID=A0ABT3PK34_9BACT|nr:hypothetical protein [Fodinibius salsisoli]MCW9706295.1 hypothetical protein [Fodinibius salsisoli]